MKKVIAFVFGAVVLSTGLSFAEDMAKPEVKNEAAVAVEVGNKICPVSKEEVGKNGMAPFQVTHNGKTYNLCCKSCAKDFANDPDKFAKIADEEAAQAPKGM